MAHDYIYMQHTPTVLPARLHQTVYSMSIGSERGKPESPQMMIQHNHVPVPPSLHMKQITAH